MIIQDNEKCTGCGACASICPVSCIEMLTGKNGFSVPKIDTAKCIKCNVCESVCHLNREYENTWQTASYYAGWNKSQNERSEGSSGGFFGIVADWVLAKNGAVFGAAFTDDCKALRHVCSDEVPIEKLKKSKYFECTMGRVIASIQNVLDAGRWVLFCGTPCQVMGVRSFFSKKNYDKLILMDFLCHGVPSETSYQKYISAVERKFEKKVKTVSFRSKKYGWKTYCMFISFEDNTTYLKLGLEDPYYKFFFSNVELRDSCYDCNRQSQSVADFTIGDYWGISSSKTIPDTDEGISLIAIHSKLADDIFCNIKDKMKLYQLKIEDVAYAFKERKRVRKSESANDYFSDDCFEFHFSFIKRIKFVFYKNKYLRKLVYRR